MFKKQKSIKKLLGNTSAKPKEKIKKEPSFKAATPSIQIVYQKLFSDQQSAWFDAENLYHVQTHKKSRLTTVQSEKTTQDRFLILARRKGETNMLHMLQVIVKGGAADVKNSWELRHLRAIDLADEDNGFVLSFDQSEYYWHVANQSERDETVWIIVQSCKHFCGFELPLGKNTDIESLGYTVKSCGTLQRFPLLTKLQASFQAEDVFAEEEVEAERLLQELQWKSEAPAVLLSSLSEQSNLLNMEIIDFLFQWEDEREGISDDGFAQQQADGNGGKPANANKRIEDTLQVLEALHDVEVELGGVDEWIEYQLGTLEDTQKKLTLIEAESGTLETSYQNLSAVSEVINGIVYWLSLAPQEEKMLRNPDTVLFDNVLAQSSLDKTDKILRPLIRACGKLTAAHHFKGENLPDISPQLWKQIQGLDAITFQRTRLTEIAQIFCGTLREKLPAFLNALLKHKSITDSSKGSKISVKHFSLDHVISFGVKYIEAAYDGDDDLRGRSSKADSFDDLDRSYMNRDSEDQEEGRDTMTSRPSNLYRPPKITCVNTPDTDSKNDALIAQQIFHSTLAPFLPLLSCIFELDSSYAASLSGFYTSQLTERVYDYTMRHLFKDLQGYLGQRVQPSTLNSLPPWRFSNRKGSPLSLLPRGESKKASARSAKGMAGAQMSLTPWWAFAVALVILMPVVRREEEVFMGLFHLESTGIGYEALSQALAIDSCSRADRDIYSIASAKAEILSAGKSPAEEALDRMFDCIRGNRILSGVTYKESAMGSDTTDGVEALGMLVVLQQYFVDHLNISFDGFLASPNLNMLGGPGSLSEKSRLHAIQNSKKPDLGLSVKSESNLADTLGEPVLGYTTCLLLDVRDSLLQRIRSFLYEQISWLQAQKGDPKKAGPASVITKVPSLIQQLFDITGGQVLCCMEQVVVRLVEASMQWVHRLSESNEKYADVVRIQNFIFLEVGVQQFSPYIDTLQDFVGEARDIRTSAQVRYVQWMVQYEMPTLAGLNERIQSLGDRVTPEEFSLYIKRKDVMNAVKDLTYKKVEEQITTMYKRLEKHFDAQENWDLDLIPTIWMRLREYLCQIVFLVERAASSSYQIILEINPEIVNESCLRYR